MRNVSNAFKQALEDGNRNYQCTAEITLTDNTQVTLTNANLLINGLSIKDNVSDDSDFTALGSVIVNAVEIRANNLSGTYSDYDFRDGIITIYVGLIVGTTVESIKIGTYIINEASIQKSVLSLYCLDYLSKFDKPYSNSTLVYPATLASILSNACIDCGVVLASTTFPNSTLTIATAPQADLTYREVVSFIATIAGCFTKCNANGQLVLQWFDSNAEHDLTALSSYDYSVSDITITGIKIITQTISESETTEVEHLFGTDDYIITIENNPFITESNVTTIGNYLVSQIAGLTFRIANISHLSDPTIEAGDVAVVTDRHGNTYNILVTSTTFNVSSYQETKCSAVEPVEKTVIRFTETQKTYATAKQLIKQEKTARQQMGQELTNAINAKAGMYETRVQESGGGYTYYLHDKPLLANSTAVIKVTNEAVAVTPDYQAATPTWYGLTVNGNFIANIMSTIGINFDWGTGGTLTLGGANNGNGVLTILDAENNSIGTWNNTGISLTKGSLRSSDYVYGTGPYFCDAGMIVNLNNKTIMTPKFSVVGGVLRATDGIFSGTITANSGTIGSWSIGSYQLFYQDEGTPEIKYQVFVRGKNSNGTAATSATPHFGVYYQEYDSSTSSYGSSKRVFAVYHDGTLRAEKAYITGEITATSLTLGSGVTVSAGKISGLASVATSGSYADLSNTPDLTVYISKDGTIGSTPAAGSTGFKVSSAGLLTASNAVIYGTIYATAGEFTGEITARTGTIGGFTVSSAVNQGTTENGGHVYKNSLYTHSSDSTYEYESGLAGGGAYNNAAFYVRRITSEAAWSTSTAQFYVLNNGKLFAKDAEIEGKITATSGSISGSLVTQGISAANITADTLSADRLAANSIAVSKLTGSIKDSGNTWEINLTTGNMTVGNISASNINTGTLTAITINNGNGTFSVTSGGALTATSGTIGGWNIGSYQISQTDTMTEGVEADQYTVAVRGKNTDGTPATSGTLHFLVAKRHYTGSVYQDWSNVFYVNHEGKLFASNADIKGKITAQSGTIGNFTIANEASNACNQKTSANGGHRYGKSLYTQFTEDTDEYEVGIKGDGSAAGALIFYVQKHTAGDTWQTIENTFYLNNRGRLYAQDAVITGQITANSLTLGNNATISKGSTPAAGSTGFNVSSAGLLTASNAMIYGTIYATAGEFTGKITANSGAIGGFSISSTSNTGTTANGGHHYTNSLYVHSTGTESSTSYEYEAGLTGNNSSTAANFYVRRIASGAAWSTSEPRFYVRNDGYLRAIIGKIGPWTMSETSIYKGGGYQSATAGSAYFGDSGLSVTDKFYVTDVGTVYIKGALHINDNGNTTSSSIQLARGFIDCSFSNGMNITSYDAGGLSVIADSGQLMLYGDTGIRILGTITENINIAGTLQTSGNINIVNSSATSVAIGAQNSVGKIQLYMAGNGNMGVYDATNSKYLIYKNSSGQTFMSFVLNDTTTSAGNLFMGSNGRIYYGGGSSRRYKKEIKTLSDWKGVLDIPVVSFKYRDNYLSKDDQRYGVTVPGFIAEDVDEHYAVAADRVEGKVHDWNARYIIPPMLAVEQDHEKRIKELENEVYELKQLIAKLI